jgi:regulator of protease activity HflC (stomatin/prohibitin superfamily)
LGVGRYWVGFNEELFLFPTFEQNYAWTADKREGSRNDESFTFQTKEGMKVGADIGISYQIDGAKAEEIFQRYRKGVDEITDIYLRNHVRDALNEVASKMPVESVYGAGKTQLLQDVQELVKTRVPAGILVNKIYMIGSFRLPKTVITSLNLKIEATQKAEQRENEIRQAKAEAQKKIADAHGTAQSILMKAKAEAEANRVVAKSITPALVQYEKIKKWDGVMPKFTGGSTPLIQFAAGK